MIVFHRNPDHSVYCYFPYLLHLSQGHNAGFIVSVLKLSSFYVKYIIMLDNHLFGSCDDRVPSKLVAFHQTLLHCFVTASIYKENNVVQFTGFQFILVFHWYPPSSTFNQ